MTEERYNHYALKALNEFKAKYPNCTSADLQSFTLGLQEGFKIGIYGDVEEDYCKENEELLRSLYDYEDMRNSEEELLLN